MEASAVDLRVAVSGAESVETDGTGGTGSVEKRKDEDLERVEGATVEGSGWMGDSGVCQRHWRVG